MENPIFQEVTTAEERSMLATRFSELEDWLYSEGDAAEISAIQNRTEELKSLMDPMAFRADEAEYRPTLRDIVKQSCNITRSEITKLNATRNWIPAARIEAALNLTDTFEAWFDEMDKKQSLQAKTDPPVLTREEAAAKGNEAVKAVEALRSIKKPVPKKKPVKTENTTKTSPESQSEGHTSESKESGESFTSKEPDESEIAGIVNVTIEGSTEEDQPIPVVEDSSVGEPMQDGKLGERQIGDDRSDDIHEKEEL